MGLAVETLGAVLYHQSDQPRSHSTKLGRGGFPSRDSRRQRPFVLDQVRGPLRRERVT